MFRTLLFICVLAFGACQNGASPSGATTFALGKVGDAGGMSDGEKWFRVVMDEVNASQLFRDALKNGTTAAKLYALCGMHLIAPGEFDKLARPVVQANQEVSMMDGGKLVQVRAAEIVARIQRGEYDRVLRETGR